MWRKLSDWMCEITAGWIALITLVIFMFFIALVLPDQAIKADAYSDEAGSPDTSFYYTTNDLYQIAEAYGEVGRQEYVRTRFTFDLIWPLVYTIFLSTSISWVFSRLVAPGNILRLANLIPVWGMLFDFFENISVSVVMTNYPKLTFVWATIAPIISFVKWIFVSGSFAVLLIGVMTGTVRWIKTRKGH